MARRWEMSLEVGTNKKSANEDGDQNAGCKREARGYQIMLRKFDALIAKYGLGRCARTL